MKIVRGKDVLLEVYSTATSAYIPFVCLRDVSINLDVELINTTTVSSGEWNTYKARRLDYGINLSGVTTILETGWNAFSTFAVNRIFSGFDVRLSFSDTDGNDAVFTCGVLLETASLTGNQDDFSTFDNTLKGNGPYVLTVNGAVVLGAKLATPGIFKIPSTTSIGLAWIHAGEEIGFRIEWSSDNVTWALLTTTSANDFNHTHTGLTAGTVYYYRIKALGDGTTWIDSDWAYIQAKTKGLPLTQVLTPVLSLNVISDTQINATWPDIANESSYELQRSLNGSVWTTITSPAANATSYNNTGLTANTHYYYRLKAIGNGTTFGDSGYSYADATTTGGAPTTFLAEWNWYEVNPYDDMLAGAFTPIGSITVPIGNTITVDTTTMPGDWYLVLRYPDTESDKVAWFNTSFNNGTIPDFVFKPVVSSGGYKYIISRNPSIFDSSAQTIFS